MQSCTVHYICLKLIISNVRCSIPHPAQIYIQSHPTHALIAQWCYIPHIAVCNVQLCFVQLCFVQLCAVYSVGSGRYP